MTKTTIARALCVVGLALAGAAVAQPQPGQVNVICSVQADWCNMIQTVFTKSTGSRSTCRSRARARRSPS